MSNIINFPGRAEPALPEPAPTVVLFNRRCATARKILAVLLAIVWFATALIWPPLKWLLSLDVLFQFLRMLYHWNTPGVHAGWTFVLHFAVLSALTYFVANPPKGFFSR